MLIIKTATALEIIHRAILMRICLLSLKKIRLEVQFKFTRHQFKQHKIRYKIIIVLINKIDCKVKDRLQAS